MNYDKNNVFAKIIRGEIPSNKVYEDDKVLAFYDLNPKADVHVLLIPKKNCISFDDFIKNSSSDEVAYFFKKARDIAELLDVKSYKIVSNIGEKAGQVVFHYHLHILGYK